MLYRIVTHWRMVVAAVLLIGLAAFALVKSVSVLAEDRTPAGGQPRGTVPAPAVKKGQELVTGQSGQAAPGVVQPTPRPPGGATSHTVQSGETLGKIAAKYGITTAALARANGISNPDMIRVGQKLNIP